jgi:hypothetical protein
MIRPLGADGFRGQIVACLYLPNARGAVAQLGEHLVCNQGVAGSIPVRSTS